MQIIEQMLTGQLPMSEFTQALQTDRAAGHDPSFRPAGSKEGPAPSVLESNYILCIGAIQF